MKKNLFVLRLLTIAIMFLVAISPVLAKPGEPQGKQKAQYDVLFTGDLDGDGIATEVNQWGMGIYGMNRITLTFTGPDYIGELNGQSIDFSGSHENGELGLHTKDKGETVRMNFGFKMDGYHHAFVLEVTGQVEGDWMGDDFSIEFIEEQATIWYKKSSVWDGELTFTITILKP